MKNATKATTVEKATTLRDLTLKPGQDPKGGSPQVSEIVVTKTSDCSSTGLFR